MQTLTTKDLPMLRRQIVTLLFCLCISPLLIPTQSAKAATYTITNCSDFGFTAALNSIQSDPAPEGTITFNCGLANTTIELTSSKLIIGRITIDGGGAVVLSGIRATQLFEVKSDASLALNNIILEKGLNGTGNGGAINVNENGSLSILQSTIRQSRSLASGGAIHSYLGSVTITSSTLEDNEAAYGGAIAHNGGTLLLSDTQVLRNFATTGDGGGAQVWNADSTFTFTSFDSNTAASNRGGALSVRGGSSSIIGGFISNNSAQNGGGIVIWDAAKLKVSHASLNLNTATNDGGAIQADGDSNLALRFLTMQGNQAYNGGAIHQNSGKSIIYDSLLLLNKSSNGPGGAFLLGTGSYDIQRSIFWSNAAPNNAGGAIHSGGSLHLTNVQLEQNSSAAGGGLRVINSTAYLTNTTVYNNTGHGISSRNVLNGSIVMHNSIVARNVPNNCDGDLRSENQRYSFSDDASCTKLTGPTNQSNVALGFEAFDLQFGAQSLSIRVPLRSASTVDKIPASACIPIDLRGIPRPQGIACDAGAIERGGFGVFLPLVTRQ